MFKKLNLQPKLIIAFIITVLLANIAGVLGMLLLNVTDTKYSVALTDYGFAQGEVGRFTTKFQEQRATMLYLVTADNATQEAELRASLTEIIAQIDSAQKQVTAHLISMGDQTSAQFIEDRSAKYAAARQSLLDSMNRNTMEQSLAHFRAECAPISAELTGKMDELMTQLTTDGDGISARLTGQTRTLSFVMLAVMLASIVICILFAIYIARSISVPLTACTKRLMLLAHGDLQAPVPVITSEDETGLLGDATKTIVVGLQSIIDDEAYLLGAMANGCFTVESKAADYYIGDFTPLLHSINGIIKSLNDVLGQINLAADRVSSGSEQVSSGAQDLSQGATEQASSVQELAASIMEISVQISDNAANANSASTESSKSSDEITQSNIKMQELIAAMGKINDSSQEIGKVIKTIEDIAFQTNILALNAAVEAARAGAAGKGFAVVADEVRNLSSKSAQAAKGTTALIEDAVRAVEHGTQIANEMASALIAVVDTALGVAGTVDKIAAASIQQAQSISQISMGIDQISSVVQTNSATAEESAAASEELSSQSQLLKHLEIGRAHV